MLEGIRTEMISIIARMSFSQIVLAYFTIAGFCCFLAIRKYES